jgi:hypothetical protein
MTGNPTNFHAFSRNLFLPVWTANNAEMAFHGLFHKNLFYLKQSMLLPLIRNIKFFVKKPMRGYFERCLSSIYTGTKKCEKV